ncbi:unnamed protein product [Medioppia subpectinata]|uniref:VWFA domain-containing protein n=1 Tax=Medioppia subpectinata TaxID=1979941 RepID=A0A7R9PTR8_9ACAR|nr:unnamed protein product [Medioppia subpectinata]CAG2100943.1 unnamed protein product [Medioppia subpectinata]
MSERAVFVLDVSGSMLGAKCQTLQLETVRFIDRIGDNNQVGIVLFDDYGWTAHAVTKITGHSVRQSIVAAVPEMARGGTDIGAGIMEGLAAFSCAGVDTNGAKIFLATDGGHCVGIPDYVGHVLPHLISAKVKVYCLAIGVSADHNLEKLATATGGQVFNLSRVDAESREMMARVMEAAMKEVITSKEMAEVVTHTVVNEVVVINGNTYETRVPIEADIGRNTQIHVRSEAINDIVVEITGPSGAVYSTTGGEIMKRLDLKECVLFMDSTESGLWAIKVRAKTSGTVRAHLVVESNPTGAQAIELQVFLKASEGNCPPIVASKLSKGNDPILSALVTATVDKPDGTQTNLSLSSHHNDGYYYAYFTDYSGAGRYNVSALAVDDGNNTVYHGAPIGQFRRQRVANSFQVMADSMPTQLPAYDHFAQLLLSNKFGSMRINNSTQSGAPVGPAPKRSGSSLDNKVVLLSAKMRSLKSRLASNFYRTKLSVNGLQVSATEKSGLINRLTTFDRFLTSVRETTAEEIDGYQHTLDDVNDKREKCFHVIRETASKENGTQMCLELNPNARLVTIGSREEQDFIGQLTKPYQNITYKAWTGIDRDLSRKYSDWVEGSPASEWWYRSCVQISISPYNTGKWFDEPCSRRALIVCERRQEWTLDVLSAALANVTMVLNEQQTLIDQLRLNMTQLKPRSLDIEPNNLTKVDSELDGLMPAPGIPIGFIYIQLPNQSEPRSMWPLTNWTDVSDQYAGLFFRAAGGTAAPFGLIQPANYSSIIGVKAGTVSLDDGLEDNDERLYVVREGQWSGTALTSFMRITALSNVQVFKTRGENRPVNTAVRVWKRIE